jgi:hypothetical protein
MMYGNRTGIHCGGMVLVMLLAMTSSFASDSGLAKIGAKPADQSLVEGCLLNAGLGNMQTIKNMAQKFGPEAVLDLMFSSVNPVFQPALLTKSNNDPARPVKNIEDMREEKYFQHAITPAGMTVPWIKVTGDGRVIAPQARSETDNNWLRLPFLAPQNSRLMPEGRTQEPVASGAMQRY